MLINLFCEVLKESGSPVPVVRGLFEEGDPIDANSSIATWRTSSWRCVTRGLYLVCGECAHEPRRESCQDGSRVHSNRDPGGVRSARREGIPQALRREGGNPRLCREEGASLQEAPRAERPERRSRAASSVAANVEHMWRTPGRSRSTRMLDRVPACRPHELELAWPRWGNGARRRSSRRSANFLFEVTSCPDHALARPQLRTHEHAQLHSCALCRGLFPAATVRFERNQTRRCFVAVVDLGEP